MTLTDQPNVYNPTDPDLVDRIFDYILSDPVLAQAIRKGAQTEKTSVAKLKVAVRAEFNGERCYIAGRPATARQEMVAQVLSLFNGRNATEVARRLNISKRTVYRVLKQPGGLKA
jgi:Mor family transcriptional regulator